jgi:selenide,water dikinase
MRELVNFDNLSEGRATILFDAQTSGGLLMAVDPEKTGKVVEALERNGTETASVIGRLVPGEGRISVD